MHPAVFTNYQVMRNTMQDAKEAVMGTGMNVKEKVTGGPTVSNLDPCHNVFDM